MVNTEWQLLGLGLLTRDASGHVCKGLSRSGSLKWEDTLHRGQHHSVGWGAGQHFSLISHVSLLPDNTCNVSRHLKLLFPWTKLPVTPWLDSTLTATNLSFLELILLGILVTVTREITKRKLVPGVGYKMWWSLVVHRTVKQVFRRNVEEFIALG